ncbi:hypothetical protein H072_8819 [Dactylellina haptotyla CBS 200.50]|uniref:Uncharacterized protein n=1 Tax=Dactylellina haptotyla (strain CBS 200.50) TaxID=1284197 RepID=S8A3D8_DACHA|nr:hypothetical protein H072_8819 [Dactylellina haptotyla CBS 200.50]
MNHAPIQRAAVRKFGESNSVTDNRLNHTDSLDRALQMTLGDKIAEQTTALQACLTRAANIAWNRNARLPSDKILPVPKYGPMDSVVHSDMPEYFPEMIGTFIALPNSLIIDLLKFYELRPQIYKETREGDRDENYDDEEEEGIFYVTLTDEGVSANKLACLRVIANNCGINLKKVRSRELEELAKQDPDLWGIIID